MHPAFWCFAAIILFLCIRLAAAWHTRQRGCDAWFFLLCAEQFRIRRRLPVFLPSLYMLEPDEQWYPPGFMVFCALFPDSFLKKYYWGIPHGADAFIACVLFAGGYAITGQVIPPLWGVAVYALLLPLISEYSSLTSRPLGCLFQLVFVLLAYGWVHGDSWLLPPVIFFGILLVYTHKLSTQVLWFLFPFFALTENNALWLLPLFAAYGTAFLIRPGYFIKLLRAHWDIVRFWHKYWPWLGAHQVKDSPLYGNPPHRAGYYAQPASFFFASFARTILENAVIVFTIPAAFLYGQLEIFAQFCFWWVLGVHIWAAAIQLLPFLRGIGIGIQYLKYSYLPSILLAMAMWGGHENSQLFFQILAGAVLVYLLCRYLRLMKYYCTNDSKYGHDKNLEASLQILKNIPDARILTLPLNLADITAYMIRKPVCWGTHGYGFAAVADILPVLRKPLSTLANQYNLTHLLLDECYATAEELHISPQSLLHKIGNYSIYKLNGPDFFEK